MGCGISRLNLGDDGMANGLRPLRRKIEEMRRNDRAKVVDGTSTKLLLKDNNHGDEMYCVIDSSEGRKSASSLNKDASIVLMQEEPKKESVKEEAVVVSDAKGERGLESETHKEEADNLDRREGGVEDVDEEVEDDDEGGRISDFDGSLLMGSPSFREYCVDYDSDDSVKDSGNDGSETSENKAQAKDVNVECTNEVCVRQGSRSRSVTKGRRGRRFRKVFPMHRPSAVKNLLNVTTCYNPKGPNAGPGKLPRAAV